MRRSAEAVKAELRLLDVVDNVRNLALPSPFGNPIFPDPNKHQRGTRHHKRPNFRHRYGDGRGPMTLNSQPRKGT